MEKDTNLSHGASGSTKERMCDVSDKYKKALCACGADATYNNIRQEFYCPLCKSKDIGAVTIPYILNVNQRYTGVMGIKLNPLTGKLIKIDKKELEKELEASSGSEEDKEKEEKDEEEEEEEDEGYVHEEDDDEGPEEEIDIYDDDIGGDDM